MAAKKKGKRPTMAEKRRKRAEERRRAKSRPPTKAERAEWEASQARLAHARKENSRLRAELKARKRNPRRPPGKWWEACLSSVAAQHHAKDPAAVCGAVWWRKPAAERARIVRELERGSARERRKAIAIARAERNRHARGRREARRPNKGARAKASKGRKENPPKRRLYALAYIEQKPGDSKPEIYEHKFSKPRPVLTFKGGGIQSRGGRFFTRGGWIHD